MKWDTEDKSEEPNNLLDHYDSFVFDDYKKVDYPQDETEPELASREDTDQGNEFDKTDLSYEEDGTEDIVKFYLHQIGRIPLLTKKQEVEFSKQIEEGQKIIHDAVFETPIAIIEVKKLLNRVISGDTKAVDFIDVPLENDQNNSGLKKKHIKKLSILHI